MRPWVTIGSNIEQVRGGIAPGGPYTRDRVPVSIVRVATVLVALAALAVVAFARAPQARAYTLENSRWSNQFNISYGFGPITWYDQQAFNNSIEDWRAVAPVGFSQATQSNAQIYIYDENDGAYGGTVGVTYLEWTGGYCTTGRASSRGPAS